jgi:hypothetical protein
VLDLVPLRGARREVADRDRQAGLGGQRRQLGLPQPVAVAVGAARIGGNQQPVCARMVGRAAGVPPAADRGDGERRGVVVHPDVDPAGIGAQVVDAVGNGQRHVGPGGEEAVVLHRNRISLRPPFPPGRGQLPELLLLLRIHTDHRRTGGLMRLDLLVDVGELRFAVGMLPALQRLGRALQAEPGLPQQPAHRRSGDRMAPRGQLVGQMPQRFRRPAQRRHRIAPARSARPTPAGPPSAPDRARRPAYVLRRPAVTARPAAAPPRRSPARSRRGARWWG